MHAANQAGPEPGSAPTGITGAATTRTARPATHRAAAKTRRARGFGVLATLLVWLGVASAAHAGSLTGLIDHAFNVTQGSVEITLDDMGGSGQIEITLRVLATPDIGDIRGVYGNLDLPAAELAGLSIIGVDVTASEFGAVDGRNFGPHAKISATDYCPCAFGAEIGTAGIAFDDIQTTTFILSHATRDLDLTMFAGQLFAVRLSNVGLAGGWRKSEAKLSGTLPVPEPSSALLLGLGLIGLHVGANRARPRA